jgi:hypothetical protein
MDNVSPVLDLRRTSDPSPRELRSIFPRRTLINVVLPEPFSPRSPIISFSLIETERPRKILVLPTSKVRLFTYRIFEASISFRISSLIYFLLCLNFIRPASKPDDPTNKITGTELAITFDSFDYIIFCIII